MVLVHFKYFYKNQIHLKKLLYILFISLFFVSCKPTSVIVTSKAEAEKKGLYKKPGAKIGSQKSVLDKKIDAKVVEKKNSDEFKVVKRREDGSYNGLTFEELSKQLVETATDKIGCAYKSGGENKLGFDCSGLMFSTFKQFDITLPRTSNEMSRYGRTLEPEEIQKGDLIFFRTLGSKVINHVGMIVEINDDEIKFVHASIKKGVIISSTKEDYYGKAFSHVNRILE